MIIKKTEKTRTIIKGSECISIASLTQVNKKSIVPDFIRSGKVLIQLQPHNITVLSKANTQQTIV
jgi:hypothetical protein